MVDNALYAPVRQSFPDGRKVPSGARQNNIGGLEAGRQAFVYSTLYYFFQNITDTYKID